MEAAGRVDEWIAPTLSRSEAGARLAADLTDRECDGRPKLASTRLVFLPFWQRASTPGLRLVPAQPELATETQGWHIGGADRLPLDAVAMERQGELRDATLEPREPAMSLLFVPFWEIRFGVGPGFYQAWVEAVSGRVVSHDDPPSREGRLDRAYGGLLALLGLALTLGFRLVWMGGVAALLGAAVVTATGAFSTRAGRGLIRRLEERR